MAKFAKLFDLADEEQVLVTVGTNENGEWQVKFTTDVGGIEVSAAPTFTVKDSTRPADPQRAARMVFDHVDQAQAEEVRARLADMARGVEG